MRQRFILSSEPLYKKGPKKGKPYPKKEKIPKHLQKKRGRPKKNVDDEKSTENKSIEVISKEGDSKEGDSKDETEDEKVEMWFKTKTKLIEKMF